MIRQEELTELRQIYNDLKVAGYKLIEVVGINTAVSHSLRNDATFQRMGELLEGMRWDDKTIWKSNE